MKLKHVLILYCLAAVYLIIVGFDIQHDDGIVGRTQKNGTGCNCHNFSADTSVHVWLAGPASVPAGTSATYTLFITGGPAVAGGFNIASGSGILSPANSESQAISGELTHTVPKLFAAGTVQWNFSYQAPLTGSADTLYSVALSVNHNGIPDLGDRWNFGNTFIVTIIPFTHSIPLLSWIGIVMLSALIVASVFMLRKRSYAVSK